MRFEKKIRHAQVLIMVGILLCCSTQAARGQYAEEDFIFHSIPSYPFPVTSHTAYERFGTSVSIALDGDRLAVGAPGASLYGDVWTFERTGGSWAEKTNIQSPDPSGEFGSAVCLERANGSKMVVGNPYASPGGKAYVYDWGDTLNPIELAPVSPPHHSYPMVADDRFGCSVSMDNGHTAVVGAKLHDNGYIDCGAAYVFYRDDPEPDSWGIVKELMASDQNDWDEFGYSVAVSPDYGGDHIVVGAPKDDGDCTDCGSAYIFERNFGGLDNWGERQKLTALDAADSDHFGYSVAIDGNYAVVGAPHKKVGGLSNAGAAYLFKRDRSTGAWEQIHEIASIFKASNALFGVSVAIDGSTVVVGALYDRSGPVYCGRAYVIEFNEVEWRTVKILYPSYAQPGESFGSSVALDGDYAVVGSPRKKLYDFVYHTVLSEAGLAYVYDSTPDTPHNDDYTSAEPVGDVGRVLFDTTNATTDGAGSLTSRNIWFCYTAPITGFATIRLCGSAYDTMLAVYDVCGSIGTLLCSNDNDCGYQSKCLIDVVAGQKYLIEVGGPSGSDAGFGLLSIGSGTITIDVDPSFASGTLNLNYTVGTMAPAWLTLTAYQYPPGSPPGFPPIVTTLYSPTSPIGPFTSLTQRLFSLPFTPLSGKDWILAHLTSSAGEVQDAASVFQVP